MQTDKVNPALQVEDEGERGHCWSCGAMREAHFCRSCGKVQPPMPTDYFSFFGLPRKLTIDEAHLQREFYSMNRYLHPDVHVRTSGNEQAWSLETTSMLNDAYRTLRDPIARTAYLLKLEGIDFEEQSKAATETARKTGQAKKQPVPPDLLEEVFELNMQLEEARMNKKTGEDDPNLVRDLQSTKASLQQRILALMDELKTHWKNWDALIQRGLIGDTDRSMALSNMLNVLNQRTYIRNLIRDVDEVLGD